MSGQSQEIRHDVVLHFFCWFFTLTSVCFVSVIIILLNNSLLNSKSKRNGPNLLAGYETILVCKALTPSPSGLDWLC
jgi:hypothetical protein